MGSPVPSAMLLPPCRFARFSCRADIIVGEVLAGLCFVCTMMSRGDRHDSFCRGGRGVLL